MSFPGMRMSGAPVMGGTTILFIAIAQLACYLFARHASGINPVATLRAE